MNTRPLANHESENLSALNRLGCNSVLLFVTETGLRKSILDATEPMRRLLSEGHIHDFSKQPQGSDAKLVFRANMLTDGEIINVPVSMYRPMTKQGDPRIWFSRFGTYAKANDVCSVFSYAEALYVLNLTQGSIASLLAKNVVNPVTSLLLEIAGVKHGVADELLGHLKEIARSGTIDAVCEGDTAIGRSIETALGIKINSSREPDYKGIEIKSGRSSVLPSRETRAVLFACVPDWQLSSLKSSRAILERFGYVRGDDFKLYCTVSTRVANSQGLQLEMRQAEQWLREFFNGTPIEEVCIWPLEKLHAYLERKHSETFWIKARSVIRAGREAFQLESVVHTSRPSLLQFDRLLSDGTVTVDHLIKRAPNGRVSEKGPLFKIERSRIGELFLGEPREHSLVE